MRHLSLGVIILAIVALVIPLSAGAPAAAQAAYVCFPSCDETDSRMLMVAGTNLETLVGDEIEMEIMAPQTAGSVELAFFDGDTGGHWDQGEVPLEYVLYADPAGNGSGTVVVGQWFGDTMADNAWSAFMIVTGSEAQAASGHYFYTLRVRTTQPDVPGEASTFKVRTDGSATMKAPQAFAFVAALGGGQDLSIIYPTWPSLTPTTYDGSWDIYLDVPASTSYLAVWDGDFDHGSFDCTQNDTDDPDTPNDVVPPWAEGTAVVMEGIAQGAGTCPGMPAQMLTSDPSDDNWWAVTRRSPSVIYSIADPAGSVYQDTNPSGNREWEQFRIELDPAIAADYHVDDLLTAGTYHIRIEGLDVHNLNAWRFDYDVLAVCDDGTPCNPILRPYLVGDTVWYDSNGNGVQDAGEPGIAGVTVELLDGNGAVLATATTDADGQYSFEVEGYLMDPDTGEVILDGVYTVRVAAENMAPGGALAGLQNTAGGTQQTNTVIDANVLTYDFGYAQTASIGDLVWRDSDADGLYEPAMGELPIGGVTVELYDAGGALVATTTTNAEGLYLFEGLMPGTYTVVIAASNLSGVLARYAQTYDYDGLLDNQTVQTLAGGQYFDQADFGYRPAKPPRTKTVSYWKTHPEAWPVESITIGGVTYSASQAYAIMLERHSGDMTYNMFRTLVAAKLNVAIGCASGCIGQQILDAEAWLVAHPLGSVVRGDSAAWQQIASVYVQLEQYNNGFLLCALHRD